MCTLTYIPKEKGEFILTHSRDESVKRRLAAPPVKRKINGTDHIFPIDPVGMGTWIGGSESGRTAALINGGTREHLHNPPYRHSRGKVILDYFEVENFQEFYDLYQFEGLEPFTLLVFENGNIFKIIHDEDHTAYSQMDPDVPFLISSLSIYTDRSRSQRADAFLRWLDNRDGVDQKDILDFHNELVFEREPDKSKIPGDHILRTVSVTSILDSVSTVSINYHDLVNDIRFHTQMQTNRVLFSIN